MSFDGYDTTPGAVQCFKNTFADVLADLEPLLGRPDTQAGEKTTKGSTFFSILNAAPVLEESSGHESTETDITEERPSDSFIGT